MNNIFSLEAILKQKSKNIANERHLKKQRKEKIKSVPNLMEIEYGFITDIVIFV